VSRGAAERWAAKNPLEAYRDIIRLWGVLNTYRPPGQTSWSKALVRHRADPGVALAGVLGGAGGAYSGEGPLRVGDTSSVPMASGAWTSERHQPSRNPRNAHIRLMPTTKTPIGGRLPPIAATGPNPGASGTRQQHPLAHLSFLRSRRGTPAALTCAIGPAKARKARLPKFPASTEYTGNFISIGAQLRTPRQKIVRCASALRANSLRIRTGNFSSPCRELNQAITEFFGRIREEGAAVAALAS
jgi:hypothetical protein